MTTTTFVGGTVIRHEWLNDVNTVVYTDVGGPGGLGNTSNAALGDALVGVKSALSGGTARTQHAKNAEWVSVMDFGAIGTAAGAGANEATDTAAFAAAMATGKSVYVPAGTYYTSATINISAGQILFGAGRAQTKIFYSGTGVGVYMGSPSVTLQYDCELRDVSVYITNRGVNTIGVMLENCVYFNVENVTCVGSGDPNSGTPANTVLYGWGLYLTNNCILGRVSRVSCRIWNYGYYLKCLSGSQSQWVAAVVFDGQGELANNMYGIVVGDPTIGFYTGATCSFRDLSIQGNYTQGVRVNTGDNTIFDSCYFEGNANYDIEIGTASGAPMPLNTKIINCSMETESIGVTAYGTFPYLAKVHVFNGSFTTIRDNTMSISTAIPLVIVEVASVQTALQGNRLNSTIAVVSRISNIGDTTTISNDNYPEMPHVYVGSFTKTISDASVNASITGVGFRPTSIEFFGAVDTTNERFMGLACVGASGLQNRCLTVDASGVNTNSADCIRLIRSSAGNEQKATVISMDVDGFGLAWIKVGTPPGNSLTVNFIARK